MHITQLDMKPCMHVFDLMPLSDRRALELVARKVVLCALFSPALVGDLFKISFHGFLSFQILSLAQFFTFDRTANWFIQRFQFTAAMFAPRLAVHELRFVIFVAKVGWWESRRLDVG